MVHEIFDGGVAAADGRLKVGDQILEVWKKRAYERRQLIFEKDIRAFNVYT